MGSTPWPKRAAKFSSSCRNKITERQSGILRHPPIFNKNAVGARGVINYLPTLKPDPAFTRQSKTAVIAAAQSGILFALWNRLCCPDADGVHSASPKNPPRGDGILGTENPKAPICIVCVLDLAQSHGGCREFSPIEWTLLTSLRCPDGSYLFHRVHRVVCVESFSRKIKGPARRPAP